MEKRVRESVTDSISVNRTPEVVFDFLRCVGNVSRWSWFRNVNPVEANLYQAEDPDGVCRFFWIEDKRRLRLILHHTGHKDSPCLVLSVSTANTGSVVHFQFSSYKISAPCRQQLVMQMNAMKAAIESLPSETQNRAAR